MKENHLYVRIVWLEKHHINFSSFLFSCIKLFLYSISGTFNKLKSFMVHLKERVHLTTFKYGIYFTVKLEHFLLLSSINQSVNELTHPTRNYNHGILE